MLLRNAILALYHLNGEDRSTKDLAYLLQCSEVGVKRAIAEARRLGANIESTKHKEHKYRYTVTNVDEIKLVVDKWAIALKSAYMIEKIAAHDNVLKNPKALKI